MTITIEEIPLPESPDAPVSWQVHGLVRVEHDYFVDVLGYADLSDSPEQSHLSYLNQRDSIRERFIAVDDSKGEDADAVLGGAWLTFPTKDNTTQAWVAVIVHPEHRRQGLGTLLWNTALERVRAHGRTSVLANTCHPVEPPEDSEFALASPTGSGRVDSRDGAVIFARRHGFTLAQVERHSTQQLPVDAERVEQFRADAAGAAGADYDLIRWSGSVPEEWLDGAIALQVAMSTDAPQGELDFEEEIWDADRYRHMEQQVLKQGFRAYTTAARHVPTGELAGYSEIYVEIANPEVAFQENTLVRKEHRGHRLGMLVKAANLARIQEVEPQVQRIHTFNAEENDYMLNINVALGYRLASVWGAWKLTLGDVAAAGDDTAGDDTAS